MSATAGSRRRRGTGHELREVVLRAATELLGKLGDVDALTMRAVAAASGVTPPSVYRHFPDKDALVQAVIAERFAEFTDALQTAAATGGKRPLERLEGMSRAYLHFGEEHPGHYRVLFSATNAGPAGLGLQPDVEHPGAASHRALVDAVGACLPASKREQGVPLATELWASLHGILDLRITKPDMPWPDRDTLTDIALTPIRLAAGE